MGRQSREIITSKRHFTGSIWHQIFQSYGLLHNTHPCFVWPATVLLNFKVIWKPFQMTLCVFAGLDEFLWWQSILVDEWGWTLHRNLGLRNFKVHVHGGKRWVHMWSSLGPTNAVGKISQNYLCYTPIHVFSASALLYFGWFMYSYKQQAGNRWCREITHQLNHRTVHRYITEIWE